MQTNTALKHQTDGLSLTRPTGAPFDDKETAAQIDPNLSILLRNRMRTGIRLPYIEHSYSERLILDANSNDPASALFRDHGISDVPAPRIEDWI